jgi:putative ABC transport system permease protein
LIAAFLGTAALIVVITTGDIAERKIGSNLAVLGNATLIKINLPVDVDYGDDPRQFNESDIEAIRAIPGVEVVSPSVYSWWPSFLDFTAVYKNTDYPDLKIVGVDPTFFKLAAHLPVTDGRVIEDSDVKNMRMVCVIGNDVRKQLFGKDKSPVGETISVEGLELSVIGLVEDPEDQDFEQAIFIPVSVARSRLPGMYNIRRITVLPEGLDQVENVYNNVRRVLKDKRPLYKITVQYEPELIKMIQNILSLFKLFIYLAISATILLAGFGVGNVMIALVRERTTEIGLSKAVGATGENIVLQFLFESTTVCLAGALIGVLIGTGIVVILSRFVFQTPIMLSMYLLALFSAITAGALIGVASGVIPAKNASRLDPIVAMRFE